MSDDPIINIIAGVVVAGIGAVTGNAYIFQIGVALTLGGVAGLLVAPPKLPEITIQEAVGRAQTSTIASNDSWIPVVYGKTRIGLKWIMVETTSGTPPWESVKTFVNVFLWMVGTVSHGEVEELGIVYFDDIPATDTAEVVIHPFIFRKDFVDYPVAEVYKLVGTDTQSVRVELVIGIPGWTVNHKGKGVAYIGTKLILQKDKMNHIPRVTVDVKGMKVFDPRTSTTIYLTNPVICLRDYLISTRYGPGIPASEINDTDFITEANYCDDLISVPNGAGGSTTQKRFEINGVIDTSRGFKSNIETILLSCRGNLKFQGGKYSIWIRKARTAETFELNQDNILGTFRYVMPGIKDKINVIKANFINSDLNYKPDVIEWPPEGITNQYLLDDNSFEIRKEINLPMTVNQYTAEQIGMVVRNESRFAIGVSFSVKEEALKLQVGDVVKVTHETPGWSAKEFWVMTIGILQNGNISIGLFEYNATAYNLDAQSDIIVQPDTTLPDVFTVEPPTDLVLSEELFIAGDGVVQVRIKVAWTPSTDAFADQYEIQYRKAGDPAYISWVILPEESVETYIDRVEEDLINYEVQVRTINSFGVRSIFLGGSIVVIGKTAPPPDVDTFLVERLPAGTRNFTWMLNSPPLDLAGYRIRYKAGGGGSWADSVALHNGLLISSPYETNLLAAGTYNFLIKAEDTTGNQSVTEKGIQLTLGDPPLSNTLFFKNSAIAGWDGVKTSCAVNQDNELEAGSTDTWATVPSTWATFNLWNSNSTSPIIYTELEIDLGINVNANPLISAEVDGTPTIEVRTKPDGGAYGAWAAPASFTQKRYVESRVTVTSGGLAKIKNFTTLIDAPIIFEESEDLVMSTYGAPIGDFTYVPIKSFSTILVAQISAIQNVGAEMYSWELISKSPSAIRFKVYKLLRDWDQTKVLTDVTVDLLLRGIPT